jgi:hypothetical protein
MGRDSLFVLLFSLRNRISPEKNWTHRLDSEDRDAGVVSRSGSRAAVRMLDKMNAFRARSDSFPEVGWGNNGCVSN